jgi:hypothetical protein
MIRVPDGKGGWTEVPEGSKANIDPEKSQEALQAAQEEDFFNRVATCAEALNKFLRVYAKDVGLSPLEVSAAVYLENCNNRHFFPEDAGGVETFDNMCTDVWAWFIPQAEKEPKE